MCWDKFKQWWRGWGFPRIVEGNSPFHKIFIARSEGLSQRFVYMDHHPALPELNATVTEAL